MRSKKVLASLGLVVVVALVAALVATLVVWAGPKRGQSRPEPASSPDVTSGGAAAPPDVTSGDDAAKPGEVHGRVISALAEGIAGAQVSAAQVTTTTDERGRFKLVGLPAGEVALDVSAPGWVNPGPEDQRRLIVQAPGPESPALTGLELVLRRPASIQGRVLAAGRPKAGAWVGLYYTLAEGQRGRLEPFALDELAQTDEQGGFLLAEVAPGRLHVLAQADDLAMVQSPSLLVAEGQQVQGVVLELAPSGALVIKVQDMQSQPMAGVEVQVSGQALATSWRAVTDGSGQVALTGISGGALRARARLRGHRSALASVELEVGQRREITLTMQPAQGLYGIVSFPSAEPSHQQAFVSVWRGEQLLHTMAVSSTGEFSWPYAPSEALRLQADSAYFASSPAVQGRVDEEVELTLGPGGSIQGVVVDGQGAAVSSYELVIEEATIASPSRFGGTRSPLRVEDAQGAFELGPLAPGRYTLRARPGQALSDALSAPIEVRAGQPSRGVVLRALAGATVSGVVTEEGTGRPVEGARVELFEPTSRLGGKSTATDAQGRYTLSGAPPGRMSLRVTRAGYATEIAAGLELRDGGRTTRSVRLSKQEDGVQMAFFGIGAELSQTERGVIIQRALDGSPAQSVGLQAGDLILSVDGHDAASMNIQRVIEKIRGEEGSSVSLEVERAGQGRVRVNVERGRVKVRR